MGCGESKHQVVANAVRNSSKRSDSKRGSEIDNLPSEKPAGNGDLNVQPKSETVTETETETKTNSVVEEKVNEKAGIGSVTVPSESSVANGDVNLQVDAEAKTSSVVEEKVNEKASQIVEAEKSAVVEKEGSGDEKLKAVEEEKKKDEKPEVVVKEKEKSEELKVENKRVEEIITEGGVNSGKSENYYSPFAKDAGVAAVDTSAVVSNDVPVQTNQTQKVDGGKVKEEEVPKKDEKESATAVVVEEKLSTTTTDQQVQVATATATATKEEIATEKPVEDAAKTKSTE